MLANHIHARFADPLCGKGKQRFEPMGKGHEMYEYIVNDGPRPTNIKNDTRLLGFRYIGERTQDMNLDKFMNAEQIETERNY